jgi:uncharacterized membrane protein YdfJ with MMPL/SSD domain
VLPLTNVGWSVVVAWPTLTQLLSSVGSSDGRFRTWSKTSSFGWSV